ncbi:rRNA maturation RNase YbeY [Lishizhenia tianjinensis]|uniref:Endoribonuclease YbeY n=1 Tax=Lishizhenia tianjinensis TaxID=477690 RepID=A0A1I7BB31_9FLAO|nr:rRNA maturation RNase YbeY [Lishizhenia tianjinensis]SFT84416.1 rRNA maturation RNase YbeY [Lishizhenia tianjinensis]
MINIFFEDVEIPNLDSEFFVSWLTKVCQAEGKQLDEVNLVFGSDEWLLEKNVEFLNHDYYTDIITFDYCEDDKITGDLFISWDRVQDNAVVQNVSRETELHRVVVHGVLHLCGYGDKSESEEKLMREKEDVYLCMLK